MVLTTFSIIFISVKLRFAGGRELDVSQYLCPAANSRFSILETETEYKFSLTTEPTRGCGCYAEPSSADADSSEESNWDESIDQEGSEEEDLGNASLNNSGISEDIELIIQQ